MRVLSQVIVILTVAMAIKAGRFRRQGSNDIDLSEHRASQSCTAKNGKQGICVHHTYCNDKTYSILPGGNIINSELREKSECTNEYEWCCTLEEVDEPPKLNDTSQEKCLATNDDEHPWLVALFKSPTDTQSATRLFCSGALVASRVVLTSGTCLKSAQKELLYVKVPASKSLQNYTVQNRRLHPNYNSGTHVNDFGILVLDKDVDWGKEKEKRVCLDFQTKSQGDCFTPGFAEGAISTTCDRTHDLRRRHERCANQPSETLLNVVTGGCRPETNGTGVSCGTNADDVCIVTPGAPVLCQSKDAVYTVVGVARSNCRKNKVSIGDISSVSSWLKQELTAMNIASNIYTYNKS